MPKAKSAEQFELSGALLNAYAINDRINQYLIESIDADAWRAEPPGGKGRTIAAIAAHMHNVRVMWLKSAAKGSTIPDQLDRHTLTQEQALAGMAASAGAVAELLSNSLSGDGKVKGFRPDAAAFLGYLIAHDAHHRGQITMLARQLGHPISQKAMFGMWEWGVR